MKYEDADKQRAHELKLSEQQIALQQEKNRGMELEIQVNLSHPHEP